jgi:hypothetical protein
LGIEDVIEVDDYIDFVNRFYSDFEWFSRLDVAEVKALIGDRSLGKCLDDLS